MKTRERILVTSLELFNGYGEPNVTTIHIADEMDISPGNLYYHFRNKDEITVELFGRYEESMLELLQAPEDRALELEDVWLYLHILFETIARYRFIYRNLVDLLSRIEKLRGPFQRIMKRKRQTALALCQGLAKQGVMDVEEDELQMLADNIILSTTFWLNYQEISDPTEANIDHTAAGVFQVLSLLIPHLLEEQKEYLRALRLEYL